MKTLIYFRDKQAISKKEFEANVPADYLDQINPETGYFSWGYFWCQFKD